MKNANKPHAYGQLTPTNFEPFPKNPHIAQIFTQMGRSEELGTGIRKVYKYSKAYSGNEHIEFIEQDIFVTNVPLDAIFNDADKSDGVNEELNTDNGELNGELNTNNGELNGGLNGGLNGELNGGLNAGQQKAFNYIQQNQGVKGKEISEKLNIPIDTMDKYLRILLINNLIERRGSKKTGGYYLTTK